MCNIDGILLNIGNPWYRQSRSGAAVQGRSGGIPEGNGNGNPSGSNPSVPVNKPAASGSTRK